VIASAGKADAGLHLPPDLQAQVAGFPVAEYLASHLVRDRVVLVGDAVHVASPMTGAGFENALFDVAALAACRVFAWNRTARSAYRSNPS
jgi:2-polyprenyl-6-methoxyphenol hydroxylase-like FAD-dependent oxidoreductase